MTFLKNEKITAEFKELELLSTNTNFVFAPSELINHPKIYSVGFIKPSRNESQNSNIHADIILSFGSALDPVDYPVITNICINCAKILDKSILITTRKPNQLPSLKHIIKKNVVDLQSAMRKTSLLIHHGGANTLAESLLTGCPQLLIPLTTDQPIQAALLKQTKAGITLPPNETSKENIMKAMTILLDKHNPIHDHIRSIKEIANQTNGAHNAITIIENILENK